MRTKEKTGMIADARYVCSCSREGQNEPSA